MPSAFWLLVLVMHTGLHHPVLLGKPRLHSQHGKAHCRGKDSLEQTSWKGKPSLERAFVLLSWHRGVLV